MPEVLIDPPNPRDLNIDKYLRKLNERSGGKWNRERLQLAGQEYLRFLILRQRHPDTELVPTELMDAVWHEHILDTVNYEVDTRLILGYFLLHCPEYPGDSSDHNLADGLAATAELYEAEFGHLPAEFVAARCAGKACHAPSNCRCR